MFRGSRPLLMLTWRMDTPLAAVIWVGAIPWLMIVLLFPRMMLLTTVVLL